MFTMNEEGVGIERQLNLLVFQIKMFDTALVLFYTGTGFTLQGYINTWVGNGLSVKCELIEEVRLAVLWRKAFSQSARQIGQD